MKTLLAAALALGLFTGAANAICPSYTWQLNDNFPAASGSSTDTNGNNWSWTLPQLTQSQGQLTLTPAVCPTGFAADGTVLNTPGTGNLNEWTLSTNTCSGANEIDRAGVNTGGCGILLKLKNGNIYTQDASNGVWEWISGAWVNLNTTTLP